MAANNRDKVLKELEDQYKMESKSYEEYEKWVSKLHKEDYTQEAWDVAQETLQTIEENLRLLMLEIIDVSTNL